MTMRYLLTSHIHCQDDVTNMQYGTIQCRKLLCAYIEYFWQWMFNKYSTFGLMLLIIPTSKASVSTRDCSLSYLDLAEAVTWTLRTRACERSMSTNAQTYWCCTASYSTLHSRSTILCHSYSLVHSCSLHFSPLCSIFCSAVSRTMFDHHCEPGLRQCWCHERRPTEIALWFHFTLHVKHLSRRSWECPALIQVFYSV